MAKDTSPLCFRLNAEDRQLVEMVAAYMGQTVSDFIRTIVVGAASRVVADHGGDKIVRELHERNQRMSDERRQLFEETARRASSRTT
jgi:uncharacterized protein (DUF1778 family)